MNYVMDTETTKGMIDAARKALDAIDSIKCTSKDYGCQDCVFRFTVHNVPSKRTGRNVMCMYDALRSNLYEMEGEDDDE